MGNTGTTLIVVSIAILAVWHGIAAYVVWLHKGIVRSRNAAIDALDALEPILKQRRDIVRQLGVPGLPAEIKHLSVHTYVQRVNHENQVSAAITRWKASGPAAREAYRAELAEIDAQIAAQCGHLDRLADTYNLRIGSSATKLLTWVMELEPYPNLNTPAVD